MLERTAVKLEPCTLPRSLPPTVRPRRNLHTGFWQHGAAALDLSSLWAPSTQVPQNGTPVAPPRGSPERLFASAFLLDFLYPKGTAAFLRRLTPVTVDRSSVSTTRQSSVASRLFTSAARGAVITHESPPYLLGHQVSYQSKTAHDFLEGQRLSKKDDDTLENRNQLIKNLQAVVDPNAAHHAPMTPAELIRGLMAKTDTEFYGSIWELWQLLAPEEQIELRKAVLKYLHRSTSVFDAERILSIFSEMDIDAWSPSQLTAAVAAHLRRDEVEEALGLYIVGLRKAKFVGGMGHLLQHAFSVSDWKLVDRVWDPWQEASSSISGKLPFGNLTPLFSVPNLGARVLELRRRLAGDSDIAEPDLAVEADDTTASSHSLERPCPNLEHYDPLLRVLAKLGLQQPCKPHEALPLIHTAVDTVWYYKYLTAAIERGDTKTLSGVYREYRQLPRHQFRPSRWILGSILQASIPHNVQVVEMIYEDYHTIFGGLDKFATGKFLNFYASRGDVESTRRVWDAFVQGGDGERVLQKAATFVPLLNAHKRRGDAVAVRQLFDELTSKYGVEPDVMCWNTLLGSVVSLGDMGKAVELLDQLCKAVEPNAITFGTIMAMSAGRGDVDLTLKLLEDARRRGVALDAAIMCAVVEAYCRDHRFKEARATCVAAANEKIPGDHAYMWNCLIRHKSHQRDLPGVYSLISRMAKYKVTWNEATEEVVLQALSRAKRMSEAYRLLRSVIDDQSFPVTERHFSIVIEGAWRTRQWSMVLALCRQLEEAGFPVSGNNLLARAQATFAAARPTKDAQAFDRIDDDKTGMGRAIIAHWNDMLQAEAQQRQPDNSHEEKMLSPETRDPINERLKVEYVHRAVESLAMLEDLPSIRKLLGLYVELVAGPSANPQDFPLPILESMMRANLLEKKHDQVKETWELAWIKARELGQPFSGEPNTILPAFRYSLSVPLAMMQKVHVAENDAKSLLALVDRVSDAGFELNSHDWNNTCFNLAMLGEWTRACQICEEMLMPRWLGWQAVRLILPHVPNRAPIAQRLQGRSPEWLRPNSHTLSFLTDEYHRLRRNALWDSASVAQIAQVRAECPRMMHAFKTAMGHGTTGETTASFFKGPNEQ